MAQLPALLLPDPQPQQPNVLSGCSNPDALAARTIAPARPQDPIIAFLNDVAEATHKRKINVEFWRTQFWLYHHDRSSLYLLPLTEQILGGAR